MLEPCKRPKQQNQKTNRRKNSRSLAENAGAEADVLGSFQLVLEKKHMKLLTCFETGTPVMQQLGTSTQTFKDAKGLQSEPKVWSLPGSRKKCGPWFLLVFLFNLQKFENEELCCNFLVAVFVFFSLFFVCCCCLFTSSLTLFRSWRILTMASSTPSCSLSSMPVIPRISKDLPRRLGGAPSCCCFVVPFVAR